MRVCRKNLRSGSLSIYALLAAMSMIVCPYSQAKADIGGVGSPYDTGEIEVNNSPSVAESQAGNQKAQGYDVVKTAYYEETQAGNPQIADDPVMIIRFNKKNVYYRNELKKVVDTVSGVRPEAVYAVQSIIPENKRYDSDMEGTENLKGVVRALSKVGVPVERIKTNVTYSDGVKTQEIRIFIQ